MISTWLPKMRLNVFAAPLAVVLAALPAMASANDCDKRLWVRYEVHEDIFTKANGVAITGEFLYPLDLVLSNLDLDSNSLVRKFFGKAGLSLGEGISGLIPHLVKFGLKFKGVDIWYHTDHFPDNITGTAMKEYMAGWGQHLIQADARNLPVADNSQDVILSHMLVNNLKEMDEKLDVVKEAIRVLKSGGEARIVGFGAETLMPLMKFLMMNYSGKVTWEFKERTVHTNFGGNDVTDDTNLLILQKL